MGRGTDQGLSPEASVINICQAVLGRLKRGQRTPGLLSSETECGNRSGGGKGQYTAAVCLSDPESVLQG